MTTSATPNLKEFARDLLIHEAATGTRVGDDGSAVFRVCEKLRGPLGRLMGITGYRSLLSRALALASAEAPRLSGLQIKPDGSLAGVSELESKLDVRTVTQSEAILVSHLVGLLVTFIGPALTQQLLRDVWPKMDELDF